MAVATGVSAAEEARPALYGEMEADRATAMPTDAADPGATLATAIALREVATAIVTTTVAIAAIAARWTVEAAATTIVVRDMFGDRA